MWVLCIRVHVCFFLLFSFCVHGVSLCTVSLGSKFCESLRILVWPQRRPTHQVDWIGRLLRFGYEYRPALVALENLSSSLALCIHVNVCYVTLNRQTVFSVGCLRDRSYMQRPMLVLGIRQCDIVTRANLGTVLNQYGVRDQGVSALRGRMFPFTPISFLLLSLSFLPFFHISSTFVVLSLPN